MFPDTTCWFKTFPAAVANTAAKQRSTIIQTREEKQTKGRGVGEWGRVKGVKLMERQVVGYTDTHTKYKHS